MRTRVTPNLEAHTGSVVSSWRLKSSCVPDILILEVWHNFHQTASILTRSISLSRILTSADCLVLTVVYIESHSDHTLWIMTSWYLGGDFKTPLCHCLLEGECSRRSRLLRRFRLYVQAQHHFNITETTFLGSGVQVVPRKSEHLHHYKQYSLMCSFGC